MKVIVQIVKSASVTVNGEIVGSIGNGELVLLGVKEDDTKAHAELLAQKVCNLRVLCDETDKMNLSLLDTEGEMLVVSNFTLCADTKKGNRPNFGTAMRPDNANELYEYFKNCVKNYGVKTVESGIFGAEMNIEASLDGPVTIVLDTDTWRKQ